MRESIQSHVQQMRKESRITQETLGEAIGVTRQTIIAIEKGNYVPSLALAMKIARYFKKRVEDIFTLQDEK